MTTATIKSDVNSWTLRLFTLLVWLLVGMCAAYWAFKFVTNKPIQATAALASSTIPVDSKTIAKLLGATDKPEKKAAALPVVKTKLTLFGLAFTARGQGIALIALEDKPAKPYRVGSFVADDLVLKSISKSGAILATSLKSPDGVTLQMPDRKAAVSGAAPSLALLNRAGSSNFDRFGANQDNTNPQVPPVALANQPGAAPVDYLKAATGGGAGAAAGAAAGSGAGIAAGMQAEIAKANSAVANGVLLNTPDASGTPRPPISRFAPRPAGDVQR